MKKATQKQTKQTKETPKVLGGNKNKTVSIKKVSNGYVVNVSSYANDNYKEESYIAKNENEAKKIVGNLL